MRLILSLALVLVSATSAGAQGRPPIELKGSLSWCLSEGVSFQGRDVPLPGGDVFLNRLDVTDALVYGAGISAYLNRNMEVGFLWDYQSTELVAQGERDIKVGDFGIDNYHGVFIYNAGSPLDMVRPIFFGGLGATHFRSLEFTDLGGNQRSTGGDTKFSTTWGGGLKIFNTGHFGIQLDVKYTPTWVKSDPGGYWCDPYWGCYTTTNPDYVNQWKFGGTLLARF